MLWPWVTVMYNSELVGHFCSVVFFELMCSVWTFLADFRKQQHLQPHCEGSDKTLRHCWGNGGVMEGSVWRAHSVEASWDDGGKRQINKRGGPCLLSSSFSAEDLEELWLHSVLSETNRMLLLPAAVLFSLHLRGNLSCATEPQRGGEMFSILAKPEDDSTETDWAGGGDNSQIINNWQPPKKVQDFRDATYSHCAQNLLVNK